MKKYIRDVVSDIVDPRDKITHTPDGVFALASKGKPALFFLEIDRGTTALRDDVHGVAKMLKFYFRLMVDGQYQRYRDDFRTDRPFDLFRVLVVTTTQARLTNMRKLSTAITIQPATAKRFVWLSTHDVVTPGAVLGSIWTSFDEGDPTTYGIAPGVETKEVCARLPVGA